MNNIKKYRNQLILLAAVALYGINLTVIKLGITVMPGWIFNFLRLGIAMVLLNGVLIHSKTYKKIKKEHLKYFISAGLASCCFQYGFMNGLNYCSASLASTIQGLAPVSILLINAVMFQKKINKYNIIGVSITLIGISMISNVFSSGFVYSENLLVGVLYLLLCQFCTGIKTILMEKLSNEGYSRNHITAFIFTITFIFSAMMALPYIRVYDFGLIDTTAIIVILYGGIISISLANTLYVWGIALNGSNKAGIYNNLTPIFAMVSAIFILADIPNFLQFTGMIVAITGFLVFQKKTKSIRSNKI